jgi:outer membrane protein OmpA-like peptidoglycan-associated protein
MQMNNLCIKTTVIILTMIFAYASQISAQRKVVPGISSSKYTEFAPTISADGRTMIFESDRDKTWKLYESHLDAKEKWSEPFPLTAINEKLAFVAGPSLSYDGNTLFFTGFIDNVSVSEDIFYSERIDERTWSEPKNMGPSINTDVYEGFSSISADGKTLYFIRMVEGNSFDRKNNEGCFAIFVSDKKLDGTWGTPEMLPSPINNGCERDPKIMADNHTLILSSIRPGGKGKYDLYQSRKQNDGTWSELIPLDFVNSEDNDQSPCISAAGNLLYFYSDEDIYAIPIPQEFRQLINVTIQGLIVDDKTNETVQASIIVKNITTGISFTTSNNPNNGQYSIVLSAGSQYSIQFINDFYISEVIDFDFRAQEQYIEIKKNIRLKSEYTLDLNIQDKDFSKNISSVLQIKEQSGQMILTDSIRADHFPYQINLKAGKSYTIIAGASEYTTEIVEWQFDPLKIHEKNNYIIQLEHIKIQLFTDVVSVTSNQKIKAKVFFNNQNSDEVIIVEAGETVTLRKGDRYQVTTSSDKGYLFSSTTIVAGEQDQQSETGEKSIILKAMPIEAGAQLTLEHISFALNASDLDTSSYVTLNRVVELLQKNPNVSIEISAHTDDIGDETYNQRLSERRALSIVRYLTKHGVEIQRMRPHGHGKAKPLVPNDSEENRARNRRVELQVLRAK